MKAKIIKPGKIENGNPVDWSFDSYSTIPALNTSGNGTLFYGYTLAELIEISRTMTPVLQHLEIAA